MNLVSVLCLELLFVTGVAWTGVAAARKCFGWTEPLRATSGWLGVVAGTLLVVISLAFFISPYYFVVAILARDAVALYLLVVFYLPPPLTIWGAWRVQKRPTQGVALMALPVPVCIYGARGSLFFTNPNGGGGIFGPKVDFVIWSLALACLVFACVFGALAAARQNGPVRFRHLSLGLASLVCVSLLALPVFIPHRSTVYGIILRSGFGNERPIARAHIHVRLKGTGWLADLEGWGYSQIRSDSNGRFLLHLRDGSYRVTVGTAKSAWDLDVGGDRDFTIWFP
jgi:hypothetical protein